MIVLPNKQIAVGNRPPQGQYGINRDSWQADGLIGWWPMLGPNLGAKRNLAGTQDDGVATGTDYGVGEYGRGLLANGGSNRVLFGSSDWASFVGQQAYTISAIAQPAANGTRRVLLGDWNAAGSGVSFAIEAQADNTWLTRYANNNSMSGGSVVEHEPAVVTVCRAGYTKDVYFYVNGVEIGHVAVSPAMFLTSGGNKGIGPGLYTGSIKWNGIVWDVRAYNRFLSPEEAYALYDPQTRWDLYRPANDRIWVPVSGGGGYTTTAVTFDGTNDYLTRGAGLTGAADGRVGTISCWLNVPSANAGLQRIMASSSLHVVLDYNGGTNLARLIMKTSSGAQVASIWSDTTTFTKGQWSHLLISWDAVAGTMQLYIDDADALDTVNSTIANGDVDWTDTDWGVGADAAGSFKTDACVADFYVEIASFIDCSVTANRRKFIDAGGKPVDLGADGSTPTGTQPIVFLKGDATNFENNLGSGGAFAVTGALTNCPTSPSDGGAVIEAALTLASTLSHAPTTVATFGASVTFANSVGVSDGTVMRTDQSVTLSQTLSTALTALASKEASASFAVTLSESGSAQADRAAQLLLSQSLGAAHAVQAQLAGAASFGLSLSQAQAANADRVAALLAALSLSQTQDGSTLGLLDAALTLSASYGVTPVGQADLAGAVAFAMQQSATMGGGRALSDAITLALTAGVAQSSMITIEGALSLGAALGVTDSVAADFAPSLDLGTVLGAGADALAQLQAALTAGVTLGDTYTSGGTTEAGVTYAVTLTYTDAGATIDTTITTPDGRRLVVQADDRLLVVSADTRTLIVN